MTGRKRAWLACGVSLLIPAIVVGPFVGRIQEYDHCRLCRSRRYATKWYVGADPHTSTHVFTLQEQIAETQIYRDLYGPSHQHEWAFDLHNTYDCFGLRWSGIGESLSGGSWIAGSYENDARFRAFAREQIAKGTLTEERLRDLVALPSDRLAIEKLGKRGAQLDSERKSLLAEYAHAK